MQVAIYRLLTDGKPRPGAELRKEYVITPHGHSRQLF